MTDPETPLLYEPPTSLSTTVAANSIDSTPEIGSVLQTDARMANAQIDSHDPQAQFTDANSIPLDTWMRLDPKYAALDRMQWWILTGVVVLMGGVGWLIHAWVTWDQFGLLNVALLGLNALFGIAGLYCGQHFPQKVMNTSSWRITDTGIEIRRGIWWKHRIFVPHDRIQHTDVNQGPIARIFNLATLVINTGGTHQPSIPLEGLNHERAEQLRKRLTDLSRPANFAARS